MRIHQREARCCAIRSGASTGAPARRVVRATRALPRWSRCSRECGCCWIDGTKSSDPSPQIATGRSLPPGGRCYRAGPVRGLVGGPSSARFWMWSCRRRGRCRDGAGARASAGAAGLMGRSRPTRARRSRPGGCCHRVGTDPSRPGDRSHQEAAATEVGRREDWWEGRPRPDSGCGRAGNL